MRTLPVRGVRSTQAPVQRGQLFQVATNSRQPWAKPVSEMQPSMAVRLSRLLKLLKQGQSLKVGLKYADPLGERSHKQSEKSLVHQPPEPRRQLLHRP